MINGSLKLITVYDFMGRAFFKNVNPSVAVRPNEWVREEDENYFGSIKIPSRKHYRLVIMQMSLKFINQMLPTDVLRICLSYSPSHFFIEPRLFDKFDNYEIIYNPKSSIRYKKKPRYMKKSISHVRIKRAYRFR